MGVLARDMTEDDRCYVGTCTHTDESREIDASCSRRVEWLLRMHERGLRVKVALADGERAGFIYVMPVEISPWGPLGHGLMTVPCLVSQSRWKGRGVGRTLIEAAWEETLRQGMKGLVTTGYEHDFWFMPASFFRRCGFSEVRGRKSNIFPGTREVLLWRTTGGVEPPDFVESRWIFEPVEGRTVVDLFWNTFCETSDIEARRVREVAAEFGPGVVLREHHADDRDSLLRSGIERGIFVNGVEVGWGFEAPREGIRRAVESALAGGDPHEGY